MLCSDQINFFPGPSCVLFVVVVFFSNFKIEIIYEEAEIFLLKSLLQVLIRNCFPNVKM